MKKITGIIIFLEILLVLAILLIAFIVFSMYRNGEFQSRQEASATSPALTIPVTMTPMLTSPVAPTIAATTEFTTTPKTGIESASLATEYELAFSTYVGGAKDEHARDVFADDQGYVYIVGGTQSADFPHTTGPDFNNGACDSLGSAARMDGFISKFAPDGKLVWSRFLGGPCYDRIYAVEVDENGFVYIAGRAGIGFPVTAGVFQTNFNGVPQELNDLYGAQNGFTAKISPDGSNLIWASYVGASGLVRDIDIDNSGNLYVLAPNPDIGNEPPSAWYTNGFQSTRPGGKDSGVMKVSNDGARVIWATWLGSPGKEYAEGSIRVDDQGSVTVSGCTTSPGFPTDPKSSTNPDVFDRTYNGEVDGFVAKLTPDGSDLVYGTYIGGSSSDNLCNTHNLAIDDQGNAFVSVVTKSNDFPTTPGVYDRSLNNGSNDIAIVKFSPSGGMVASTLIGGSGYENPDGIYVSEGREVFITGETDSTDFPVVNALQDPILNFNGSIQHGQNDAVILLLSADFSQLLFSTYMGGTASDNGRSGFLDQNGSLYVTGSSNGAGWPSKNAYQDTFAGGSNAGDVIVAKIIGTNLSPSSTPGIIPSATPSPSPTSSPTPLPTSTRTSTPTSTLAPTSTPEPTSTVGSFDTPVPTNTAVPLPTDTPKPLLTNTLFPTNTPWLTYTPLPTFTNTPLPTGMPLPTFTPLPTLTHTPLPTNTAIPAPAFTPIPTTTPEPIIAPPVFQGEYFDNKNLKGDPTLVRNDKGLNFDWGRGSPDRSIPKNNFSVRWTKEEYFSGGIYGFTMWHDDGLRMYIDDQLVYDSWKKQKARLHYINLSIPTGLHTIKIEYYENRGDAEVGVVWDNN